MTRDYFAVFGLEPSFDLDLAVLEKKYFEAQRRSHPDKAAGDAPARMQALQDSMLANEAYEALKSPLKRARHLLAQSGIQVGGDHDTVKASPELLMQAMEWGERREEAESDAQKQALTAELEADKTRTLAEISQAFAQKDHAHAAQLTLRLNYLLKLR